MKIKSCDCQPFQSCESCAISLDKPGDRVKNRPKTKSKYIHKIDPPEDKSCTNCGRTTGTEVYRHAEDSTIKFLLGGGIIGDKIDDKATSWLCSGKDCGQYYDTKPDIDCPEIVRLKHDLFTAVSIIKTHLL